VDSLTVPGFKMNISGTKNFIEETYFKQLIGSLIYLTIIRPNMTFVYKYVDIWPNE